MFHLFQRDNAIDLNVDNDRDGKEIGMSSWRFPIIPALDHHLLIQLLTGSLNRSILIISLLALAMTMRADASTPILSDNFELPDALASYRVFGFGEVILSPSFTHHGQQALKFKTNGKGWGCVAMRNIPQDSALTPNHVISYWVHAPGVFFPDATLAIKVIFGNGSEWALREEYQLPIHLTGIQWTPLVVPLAVERFQWDGGTVPEKQGIFEIADLTQIGIVFYSGRHVLEIYVDDVQLGLIDASAEAPEQPVAAAPHAPTPAPISDSVSSTPSPPASLATPSSSPSPPPPFTPTTPKTPLPPVVSIDEPAPPPVSSDAEIQPSSRSFDTNPAAAPTIPPEEALSDILSVPVSSMPRSPPSPSPFAPVVSKQKSSLSDVEPPPIMMALVIPALKKQVSKTIPEFSGLIDDFSPAEQYNDSHRNDVIIPGQRTGGITDVHCLIIEQTTRNRFHNDGILSLSWSRPNMCWFTTLSRTGIDISANRFLVLRMRSQNPAARITIALDSTGSGEGEPLELPSSGLQPEFTTNNIPLAFLGSANDLQRVNALALTFLDDDGEKFMRFRMP
jgi:hypothetical protein